MPNMIIVGAFLIWPLVVLILMSAMSTQRAVIWSLLAGYLLLPARTAIDFPGIPNIDKTSVPNVAVFLIALFGAKRGEFLWPRSLFINVLMFIFVFGPIVTGFFNSDAISVGNIVIPAMDLYTSLSYCATNAFILMPFILGAGMLRHEENHQDLVVIFALAGLAYSIPVLAEIRLSPFLLAKVYGIHISGMTFFQQMRGGGFRSMAFLGHGLLVSTFIGMTLIAAVGLYKMKRNVMSIPAGFCAIYLFVVLVLNKSAGAILMSIVIIPLFLLMSRRKFLTLCSIVGLIIISYPMLRANGLIPTDTISRIANNYSAERGQSLDFRLHNEDMLLERANHRPILGWGGFGRSRIYDVTQGGQAQDVSVTDGTWIIAIGTSGWMGYIAMFGLLCYPFWHIFKMRKLAVSMATCTMMAMLVFNLLDLIPNSSLRPITWLISGALCTFALAPQAIARRKPAASVRGPLRVGAAST